MNDELLPYYESELAYLRRLGDEFARDHPAAAWALRMTEGAGDGQRDPHIERFLQGVAFLNARIRHRLDDDFPELAESLLNTLYPHYLAPFPSCAIAELTLELAQVGKDAAVGRLVPKKVPVEYTHPDPAGAPIQFRTVYPTYLLPVRVAAAEFMNERFDTPQKTRPREALAALRIDLETMLTEVTFDDLAVSALGSGLTSGADPDQLTFRFFLHGQTRTVNAVYDQILRSAVRIVCYENVKDPQARILPANLVSPVGFQPDEELLPRDGRILNGYRLVHEFFAFPQKFHFIDFSIPRSFLRGVGRRFSILIMTNEENEDLASLVDRDTLRLGCTPLVNLFERRASFSRTYRQSEYRLIVDRGYPLDYEVFSIQSVTATSSTRDTHVYRSFYDIFHTSNRSIAGYWHAHRRQIAHGANDREVASELYLSLVDRETRADLTENATVSVELTCMNRNRRDHGPGSAGESAENLKSLTMTEGDFGARARLLTWPTSIQRITSQPDWRWRLSSHLALNHLSLTDLEDGTDGFREILRLYNISNLPVLTQMIEGLTSVSTRRERITRRLANGPHAFAHGMEVTLTLREAAFPEGGLFLFATLLSTFMANYCTINSFVETVLRSHERNREIYRWPAQSGTRPLL